MQCAIQALSLQERYALVSASTFLVYPLFVSWRATDHSPLVLHGQPNVNKRRSHRDEGHARAHVRLRYPPRHPERLRGPRPALVHAEPDRAALDAAQPLAGAVQDVDPADPVRGALRKPCYTIQSDQVLIDRMNVQDDFTPSKAGPEAKEKLVKALAGRVERLSFDCMALNDFHITDRDR
jgi:hypothetical protein